jgi:hypothetical protein
MAALLSLFTSTGFGGIVGILGSWLTKREERKNLELKYEHDFKMAELRRDEIKLESAHELAMADKQMERTQVEGNIALGEAELSAFQEGLREQNKTYGIKFVDGVRGLMRPLITLYLLAIATMLTYKINELVGGISTLPIDELINTYKDVINQMLFLTATAVTWWFGSRPSSGRDKK